MRKFLVVLLFILSILAILGEVETITLGVIAIKAVALIYFWLFCKANKLIEG